MERRLKERLTGAAVLVMVAVIFIPMILDDSAQDEHEITGTNIPARPEANFNSRIIPIEEVLPDIPVPIVEPEKTDSEESPPHPLETTHPAGEDDTSIAVATLGPAPVHEKSRAVESAEPRGLMAWVVQLGSFSSQENANSLVINLQNEGYPGYVEAISSPSGILYRVRVGPELLKSDAEKIQADLKKKLKLDGIIQRYP